MTVTGGVPVAATLRAREKSRRTPSNSRALRGLSGDRERSGFWWVEFCMRWAGTCAQRMSAG
jgi:hypothetical protein